MVPGSSCIGAARTFSTTVPPGPATLPCIAIEPIASPLWVVLGTGELTRKLDVSAHKFSQAARDKIAAQGGTVQEIG